MALTSTEEAQLRDLIAQQAALLSLASSESTIISKLGATKATLSDLSAASSLGDSDLFLVRQGTTDKSATGAALKALATAPAASSTVAGVIKAASTATTQAGTATDAAVTPAGLVGSFVAQQSLSGSGYQKLPGGLILQWGNTAVASMDAYTINFPVAFPTECQLVIGGWVGPDSVAGVLGNASRTTTGVSGNMNGSGAATVNWLAIGY